MPYDCSVRQRGNSLMRYSQLIAPRRSTLVQESTPPIRRGEVLVEIKACGVCASELHPWMGEVKEPEYPGRLGREPAGIVREAGPGVTQFAPGDRVTGLFGKAYSDVQVVDEGR